MNKLCFKCQITKPIEDFYKHKGMSDGYLNKCKNCTRNDTIQHRKNNDSVRNYDKRRYYENPDRQLAIKKTTINWINKNPEARAAHIKLNNAVKSGLIKKQPCGICGDTYRIHGHHKDYSKPLEVEWLCAKHHQRHHADD